MERGDKPKVVKKGTRDWWTTIAMVRIADRQRQAEQIADNKPVTLSTDDINAELQYLDRHFLVRMWVLFTNGDMTEKIVGSALGDSVKVIDSTAQGERGENNGS